MRYPPTRPHGRLGPPPTTDPTGRTDSRQAYLRLVATTGALSVMAWAQTGSARAWSAALLICAYCALAAGALLASRYATIRPALMRPVSLITDVTVTTVGVYCAGDAAVALFPVYVTLAGEYGLRFGDRYLWWAAALSAAGLLYVLAVGNPPLDVPQMAAGVAMALAIAMVYTDALLRQRAAGSACVADRRAHSAVRSADADDGMNEGRDPTAATVPANDVLDRQVLANLQRLGRGDGFLAMLADGFVKETQCLLRDLEQALAGNDYGSYRDHLHALKGDAANIGARQLYLLCQKALELGAKDLVETGADQLRDIQASVYKTFRALADCGAVTDSTPPGD